MVQLRLIHVVWNHQTRYPADENGESLSIDDGRNCFVMFDLFGFCFSLFCFEDEGSRFYMLAQV
jgi:hypothetical protein